MAAKKKKQVEAKNVYQLKVTLKGIKPPIWRRLEVTDNITLRELHGIIQAAMGWEGYHLYQFKFGNAYYGEPDPDYGDDMEDDSKIRLSQVAGSEKMKFIYEYDFGDSWEHEVLIEKILPVQADKHYPVCTKGSRACPPEDVGGVWGYADFLDAIGNPDHPEHEDMMEWSGGDFDPEAFDIEYVNSNLK